jgi:galactose mutarotase-like enzyme
MADVVLGYDNLEAYTHGTTYGAVIGRFANRIGNAQFTLGRQDLQTQSQCRAQQYSRRACRIQLSRL